MFLDVQLGSGERAGLELARAHVEEVRARGEEVMQFVLATASRDHALEAYDLGVVDYLLKPFTEERVTQCLQRVLARRPATKKEEPKAPERIVARRKKNLVFLDALLKTYDPRAIRLGIVAHHYRHPWEWHDQLMPTAAARLDAWMAQRVPNSPLIGHGADFVQAGVQNGVDPRFLVAVAAQESGLGTAGSGANINNPFGWGPAKPFASWTESIQTVAAGLAKGYLGEGRDTIAAIQAKWAPVGAANDPGGLNSNWTAGVSKLYAEMGGSPAGTVRI